MSYVKENEPRFYQFFVEYWELIKKYWKVENREEWWDIFISDMTYYTAKYDRDDFCVELLMELYERAKNKSRDKESLASAKTFLNIWWEYVNKYYQNNESEEWWIQFSVETDKLLTAYSNNTYYYNLINAFYCFKVHSNEEKYVV